MTPEQREEVRLLTKGRTFKSQCSQCGQQFRARACGISHATVVVALTLRAKHPWLRKLRAR